MYFRNFETRTGLNEYRKVDRSLPSVLSAIQLKEGEKKRGREEREKFNKNHKTEFVQIAC